MNKYWDNGKVYNNKEYALGQLTNAKLDILSLARQIEDKLDELDKIECGLTTGHKWQLHKFCDTAYPMAEPPGVYWYKCKHCKEVIILRACDKKIWEASLKLDKQN